MTTNTIRETLQNKTMLDTNDISLVIEQMNGSDDFEVGKYRFISADAIDEIQQDELASDLYALGCFNADFIADVMEWPVELVEAAQKGEAFEALGKAMLPEIAELQAGYADADGYGHHFAYYDHETIDLDGWYAFRIV